MKYIASIIALSLAAIAPFTCPAQIAAAEPSDAAVNAKRAVLDVTQICEAMNTYRREFGAVPPGDAAQIMDALTSGNNAPRIVFFQAPQKAFNAKGEFLDLWGTPLRIGRFASGDPWAYSCGENQIDEGGVASSDDIASWR